MATTVTSTINKSGNDYSTLTAWEAAKQGNLVSNDQIQEAACYDDNGALNEKNISISGSTVDSTRYMRITAPVGDRHSGIFTNGAAGNGFLISPGEVRGESVINCADNYVEVSYIQVQTYQTGYGGSALGNISKCHHNLVKDTSTGSWGISCYYGDGTLNGRTGIAIYRNVFFGSNSGGNGAGIYMQYGTGVVYNNTIYGMGSGTYFYNYGLSLTVKNNLLVGNGTDWGYNAGGTTTAKNISSDASSPDTSYRNKTITFTNAGGGDFHTSDSDSVDAGDNLGSPYDIDIDGQTVSGSWDIGADENAATDVTVTPSTLTLALTLESSTRIATQLPSAQALTAALQSPTPEGRVLPSAQALTSSLQTPVPMVTFLPSALGLVSTLQTPTCLVTIFPSEQGLTLTLQSPSVDTGSGNVTFMASTLAMTLDLLAPTLQVTVSPSALALVASLQAAGFEVKMNPATLTISASLNSITPAITLTPAEFQLATSVLAVSPKVNLTPSEIALTLALLNPSINPGIGEALQQIISSDERLRQVLSSVERLRLENDNLQG